MSITGDTKMPDGGGFANNYIFMPLQSATQWDGLAHVFYDDHCYNGVPTSTVTARGASELGIENLARGIVGRGVVLDIARLRGVDHLEPGDSVGPDDLQAACDRQGVEVGPGDVLLVRTGWIRVFKERSAAEYMGVNPGLTMECPRWLKEHDVAVLACDNWSVSRIPAGSTRCSLALRRDSRHGDDAGRDVRPRSARRGLRSRRRVGLLLHRADAQDRERGRLSPQPARDQ